jgi:transposase
MQLRTILNRVQKFKSFVYESARWDETWIGRLCLIVSVLPRANSRPICSGCEKTRSGYDTMKPRRFEFIPVWNIPVFFEYAMRRVDCPNCGVKVEKVPVGVRQVHADDGVYAVLGALGAKAVLERDRHVVSHDMG